MWDFLYAIDASASMGEPSALRGASGGPKVEVVKREIMQLVGASTLPYGARVGVICFRGPAKAKGRGIDPKQQVIQKVIGLTPLADLKADPGRYKALLDEMRVGGTSLVGEGLKAAVEMIHDQKSGGANRIKQVILVTDGKSSFGAKPKAMPDAKLTRRVIVDVVAIERGSDKALEALAKRSGGRLTVVSDANDLIMALDPKVPYVVQEETSPLAFEADRVAKILSLTSESDPSYSGIVSAASAVRSRVERKLHETTTLEGEARADFDLALSAATSDPKFPTMSMREFADRVWARGADLARLEALKDQLAALLERTMAEVKSEPPAAPKADPLDLSAPILLMVDPTASFEKSLASIARRKVAEGNLVYVFTSKGSPIHYGVPGGEGMRFYLLTNSVSYPTPSDQANEFFVPQAESSIILDLLDKTISASKKAPLTLIFDSISDMVQYLGADATYKFLKQVLQMVAPPNLTSIYLLLSGAQDDRTLTLVKGLFRVHAVLDQQGIRTVKGSETQLSPASGNAGQ